MKRLLTLILGLVMAVSTFTLFACNNEEEQKSSAVLVGLSNATMVTPVADYDYFLVPEPAATTKVNATGGKLQIAGSLQELYGEGQGYPQAVLVAKKSVLESDGAIAQQLVNSFAQNLAWLKDENVSSKTIVDAVVSALPSETSPTFTEDNLSKTVISNCGIDFKSAQSSKNTVNAFMGKVNAVAESSFGTAQDGFFHSGEYNTNDSDKTLSLYCPDGAPALSVARLINDETIIPNLDINAVVANTINSKVAGENPVADFCILPVNVAVKLLGNANAYQMLGVVTNGNLFILKKQDGKNVTKQNAKEVLNNKKIGVINLANVPGLTLKVVLKDLGVEYSEPTL